MARRARRTGNVFWGCSAYPKCDFTTNHEPLGAIHDADGGPVARRDEGALCLKCGAAIDLPIDGGALAGRSLAGGPPDPAALVSKRPRPKGARGGPRTTRTTRGSGSASGAGRRGPARGGRAGGGSPAA